MKKKFIPPIDIKNINIDSVKSLLSRINILDIPYMFPILTLAFGGYCLINRTYYDLLKRLNLSYIVENINIPGDYNHPELYKDKIIFLQGLLKISQSPIDPLFELQIPNTITLRRKSERYQKANDKYSWKGDTQNVFESILNFNNKNRKFKEEVRSKEFLADSIKINNFEISSKEICNFMKHSDVDTKDIFKDSKSLRTNKNFLSEFYWKNHHDDNYRIYGTTDNRESENPQKGDIRMKFSTTYVKNEVFSLIGKYDGNIVGAFSYAKPSRFFPDLKTEIFCISPLNKGYRELLCDEAREIKITESSLTACTLVFYFFFLLERYIKFNCVFGIKRTLKYSIFLTSYWWGVIGLTYLSMKFAYRKEFSQVKKLIRKKDLLKLQKYL